jgi:hypothetical protein
MRTLMLVMLLLSARLPCFSGEACHALQPWQTKSLEHISDGSVNLFLNEPWHALVNFQKAAALVDSSDGSVSAISFLISFFLC